MTTTELVTRPSGPLLGTLRVPGDKSITHRAIILSALAEGETTGKNCLLQPSPFDCISAIGSVEGMLAKSKQQRIACDWASGAWLPNYSQLRLAWNYKMMPSPAQSNSLSAIWTLMQQSRPLGC